MAQKIDVQLPEDIVIGDGWTVIWDAVDATTGASVSGVTISGANLTAGGGDGGGGVVIETGPYMLVPGPGA